MTETKPKRRWFRFSIRDLLWLAALIAMGLGWAVDHFQELDLSSRREYFIRRKCPTEQSGGSVGKRPKGMKQSMRLRFSIRYLLWLGLALPLPGTKPPLKLNRHDRNQSETPLVRILDAEVARVCDDRCRGRLGDEAIEWIRQRFVPAPGLSKCRTVNMQRPTLSISRGRRLCLCWRPQRSQGLSRQSSGHSTRI